MDVQCCGSPSLLPAYVWFWPFRAVYCQCCGEVTPTSGRFLEAIWTFVVAPFWDGRVKVNYKGQRP